MYLKLVDINDCQSDFDKIDQLYHKAFPDNERAPIQLLIQKANEGKGEFLGIYDEKKWIGLVYVITYQELSYVFYLAIDSSCRGHGYGSAVLQQIKNRYDHTIMLCIEEVKPQYDNYEQRVQRKKFYFKNGFKEMDFYFTEAHVRYEMLYDGKKISSHYFDELMLYYAGEEYRKVRDFE
ncbi:MAG: GNAT family N-acetyltransferase [Faecalibacillus sp.]